MALTAQSVSLRIVADREKGGSGEVRLGPQDARRLARLLERLESRADFDILVALDKGVGVVQPAPSADALEREVRTKVALDLERVRERLGSVLTKNGAGNVAACAVGHAALSLVSGLLLDDAPDAEKCALEFMSQLTPLLAALVPAFAPLGHVPATNFEMASEADGTPVQELALDTRTRNCLAAAGITTAEQAAALSDEYFLKMPRMGVKSLCVLRTALCAKGIAPQPNSAKATLSKGNRCDA